MAIWFVLQKAAVFVCFCALSNCDQDLLENLKLGVDNPPELTEFLESVLKKKDEFRKIRFAAKEMLKTPKSVINDADDVFNKRTYNLDNIDQSLYKNIRKVNKRYLQSRPINDVYPYMFPENEIEKDEREERSSWDEFPENPDSTFLKKKSNKIRYRKGLDLNDYNSENDIIRGNIEVRPRSKSGVRNVPGNKYSEHRRSISKKRQISNEPSFLEVNVEATTFSRRMADKHGWSLEPDPTANALENMFKLSAKQILFNSGLNEDLDTKARNLEQNTVRPKRSMKLNIIDDENLIKSVKQDASGNALILTLKMKENKAVSERTNNIQIQSNEAKVQKPLKSSDLIPLYPLHQFNNKNPNYINLLHNKMSYPGEIGVNYRPDETPINSRDHLTKAYDSDEKKQNKLEDMDEPTSAIEQHELSTKPYLIHHQKPDVNDLLQATIDLLTNKFADIFTTPASEAHFSVKEASDMVHGKMLLKQHNLEKRKNNKQKPRKSYYLSRISRPALYNGYNYNYADIDHENNYMSKGVNTWFRNSGVKRIINRPSSWNRNQFFSNGNGREYNDGIRMKTKSNFQRRKILSYVEEVDNKYGDLDYENGNNTGAMQNKIRVKRDFFKKYPLEEKNEESVNDEVVDYSAINQKRSDDYTYEEEGDSDIAETQTYKEKKQDKSLDDVQSYTAVENQEVRVTNIFQDSLTKPVTSPKPISIIGFGKVNKEINGDSSKRCNCNKNNLNKRNHVCNLNKAFLLDVCKDCNSKTCNCYKNSNNKNKKINVFDKKNEDFDLKKPANSKEIRNLSAKLQLLNSKHRKNNYIRTRKSEARDELKAHINRRKYNLKPHYKNKESKSISDYFDSLENKIVKNTSEEKDKHLKLIEKTFKGTTIKESTTAVASYPLLSNVKKTKNIYINDKLDKTRKLHQESRKNKNITELVSSSKTGSRCISDENNDFQSKVLRLNNSEIMKNWENITNSKIKLMQCIKKQPIHAPCTICAHSEINTCSTKYKCKPTEPCNPFILTSTGQNECKETTTENNFLFNIPTVVKKSSKQQNQKQNNFHINTIKKGPIQIVSKEIVEFAHHPKKSSIINKYNITVKKNNCDKTVKPSSSIDSNPILRLTKHHKHSEQNKTAKLHTSIKKFKKDVDSGTNEDESWAEYSVNAFKNNTQNVYNKDNKRMRIEDKNEYDMSDQPYSFDYSFPERSDMRRVYPRSGEYFKFNKVGYSNKKRQKKKREIIGAKALKKSIQEMQQRALSDDFVEVPRETINEAPFEEFLKIKDGYWKTKKENALKKKSKSLHRNPRRYQMFQKRFPQTRFRKRKERNKPARHQRDVVTSSQRKQCNDEKSSKTDNYKVKEKAKSSSMDELKNKPSLFSSEMGRNSNIPAKTCLEKPNPPVDSKATAGCKDSGQMNEVVNGHLASIVVNEVFKRIKQNPQLHSRFSHGLYRKHGYKSEMKNLDAFRNTETEGDLKNTQMMLNQIMKILNKIIKDQVQRTTCKHLSPELKKFLADLTKTAQPKNVEVDEEAKISEEGYPLPLVKSGKKPLKHVDEDQGLFLFNNPKSVPALEQDELSIRKKMEMIKNLLEKYKHMSGECKVKVGDVEDYLKKHLSLLKQMLKSVKKQEAIENKNRPDFSVPNKSKRTRLENLLSDLELSHDQTLFNKELDHTKLGTTQSYSPINIDKLVQDKIKKIKLEEFRQKIESQAKDKQNNKRIETKFGSDSDLLDANEDYEKSESKRETIDEEDEKKPSVSEKYKKLIKAAELYRKKRENEDRIGMLFGKRDKKSVTKNKNAAKKVDSELLHARFETPTVFSIKK